MYRELNDNEIIYMINENDDYYEIMLEKYKPVITKMCRKYLDVAKTFGYELNDLIQVASIALLDAIKTYKEEKNILFYTYVIHCINNALKNEVRNQLSNRKRVLNTAISYDELLPDSNHTLIELIKDEKLLDQVDYLILKEKEDEYTNFINLLPIDVAVSFEMKNMGFKISEIAKFLGSDEQKIFNNIKYAKNRICLN